MEQPIPNSWSEWQISPGPKPAYGFSGAPQPDWAYEMRRQSQLIIPGLYLGPVQSALDSQKMKEMGITHVFCVRDKKESRSIYPRFPHSFKYYILEISDNDDEKIIRLIPDCLKFIDQAIMTGGTVLAHCLSGISLSPAIVISYLMTKFTWPYYMAISFVQSKRFCVSPSKFYHQLKEYESIYKAAQMYGQNTTRSNGVGKRELEDDDDINDHENERNYGKRPLDRAGETVAGADGDGDGDIQM